MGGEGAAVGEEWQVRKRPPTRLPTKGGEDE